MKKQVFISGPILGMEDNQDIYRNTITAVSQKLGFDVIDPWKPKNDSTKEPKTAGGTPMKPTILCNATSTTPIDAT